MLGIIIPNVQKIKMLVIIIPNTANKLQLKYKVHVGDNYPPQMANFIYSHFNVGDNYPQQLFDVGDNYPLFWHFWRHFLAISWG